ncbi:MAG: NHLP bacteriocin system secretion protein [Moorea sp. SIO2I5]|nr:NHLP bacteriocin system secretion protein [Moorena sp. SIO2I5]
MFKNKKSLFRQESLERLSSPEQLDQLMQVVNPRDWLPIAALGGLVFLAVIWSIFGRIPITVTGQGVLIRPRRLVQFQSTISGQLDSLNVGEGQCFEKNYVLATIDPSELKKQLQLQRRKLSQLQVQDRDSNLISTQLTQLEKDAIANQRASLEQRLQDATALTPVLKEKNLTAIARQRQSLNQQLRDAMALTPVLQDKGLKAIAQQRQSLEQRLRDLIAQVPVFKRRWQKRQELSAVGGIAEDAVLQAEQEYRQAVQSISELEAQLKQLDVSETETQGTYVQNLSAISEIQVKLQELSVRETEAQQKYLDNLSNISQIRAQLQELDSKEKRLDQQNLESSNQRSNQIQDVKLEIARLEKQVADKSKILSAYAGCVVEIAAARGQVVQPGTQLGTMTVKGKSHGMEGITYFSVKDGKKIQPGMLIQITPDTVKLQRFGGIVGKITSVSPYPVTREGAASVVGNPEVVDNLIGQGGAMIEVYAKLEADNTTFSGYQWSSSDGPDLKISAGTTTTARVRVKERVPITFVLPILREWSGIY